MTGFIFWFLVLSAVWAVFWSIIFAMMDLRPSIFFLVLGLGMVGIGAIRGLLEKRKSK